MKQVREYNIVVRVRVATYESDADVQNFCTLLAAQLAGHCAEHQYFINANNPSVEMTYVPST